MYLITEIIDSTYYQMDYNHTISCCESCFLSMSDSVVFLFDDTIKMVHSLYDTTSPSNNIYNSLYFVEDNANCLFEYFVTSDDYQEAVENQWFN
jgi:hypothetical protein